MNLNIRWLRGIEYVRKFEMGKLVQSKRMEILFGTSSLLYMYDMRKWTHGQGYIYRQWVKL